jgi:hypothetical protein
MLPSNVFSFVMIFVELFVCVTSSSEEYAEGKISLEQAIVKKTTFNAAFFPPYPPPPRLHCRVLAKLYTGKASTCHKEKKKDYETERGGGVGNNSNANKKAWSSLLFLFHGTDNLINDIFSTFNKVEQILKLLLGEDGAGNFTVKQQLGRWRLLQVKSKFSTVK